MQYIPIHYRRPLRFGLVGLSGLLVNSALLWALVRGLAIAIPLASMLATEVAIISNFALNDRWTFGRVQTAAPRWQRFLRFNGVALGGMLITATLLTLLTSYAHLPLLLANLLAVGGAMAWNYVLNSRWTWRSQPSAPLRRAGE